MTTRHAREPAGRPLAIVNVAALDLRRNPDHRAEMCSQLLLGETVVCLSSDRTRRWIGVQNQADGYRGWVRSWGLFPATESEAANWRRSARLRVVVHHARLLERPGRGRLVSPVFLNTRLAGAGSPARGGRGWRLVGLPDGRRGWLAAGEVRVGRGPLPALRRHAESFYGIPYLWGGRTPMGYDCSGFVQQLLASRGIDLPRDADDQYRATRRLPPGQPGRAGDLVFFGPRRGRLTHVGILLGRGLFAHARGCVMVNSLKPGNRLFDSALYVMVRGYGRPKMHK